VPDSQKLFERAGGEAAVRAVVDEFVRRVSTDLMIGFFFSGLDLSTLREREYQFTAKFLGSDNVKYEGRSLKEAHARHKIMGGQFDRRKQILHDVLVEHGIATDVRLKWIEHVEELRALVTSSDAGQCD
jgi:hemoglobin